MKKFKKDAESKAKAVEGLEFDIRLLLLRMKYETDPFVMLTFIMRIAMINAQILIIFSQPIKPYNEIMNPSKLDKYSIGSTLNKSEYIERRTGGKTSLIKLNEQKQVKL